MIRPLACALAMAVVLFPARAGSAQSLPDYGPLPVLPEPDPSHRAVGWSRVVGWPTGETPNAPPGFAVSLYAAGLHNPRNLHVLPNGDVLVVESNNPGSRRDWAAPPEELAARFASRIRGASADRITLLRDTTGDGAPDVREILLSGLRQPFGVASLGEYLYVANTDALVRFRYTPGQLEITAGAEKVIDLPAGGYNNHWTRNVIADADGRKLYVSVGSATNVDVEGIDAEDPRRAAILELDPDGGNLRIFASGLRNPVGLDWAPGTRTLWTAVNERDGLGDSLPPDYVTGVHEGAFYGWPFAYFGPHEDPRHAGRRPDLVRRAITPDYAMGAHTATLDLLFYTGESFPERYRRGLFVTQRGSWNRERLAGYRVAFLPFCAGVAMGPEEDFLVGFVADPEQKEVHGRPAALAVLADGSLLVADDASNVIWRVQWIGEADSPAMPLSSCR